MPSAKNREISGLSIVARFLEGVDTGGVILSEAAFHAE
jgi:hypothetical protein